jgi:hypothetical protein
MNEILLTAGCVLIIIFNAYYLICEFYNAYKNLNKANKYIERLKAVAKMRGVDLEDVFDDRSE